MDLHDGICTVCQTNDKILPALQAEYYLELTKTAFFENHNEEEEMFCSHKDNFSLCVMCAFKIEMASTFKEQFQRTVIRQMTIKKSLSACFICDIKDRKLIKTEADPNLFYSRIKVFMGSVLTPRLFKQCAICMYCLYHFNIWFEMRTTVFKLLGRSDLIELLPKLQQNSKGNAKNQSNSKIVNRESSTLSKSLAHLQLLKEIKTNGSFKLDDKLTKCIPYVSIDRETSIQNKSPLSLSKPVTLNTTGTVRKSVRNTQKSRKAEGDLTPLRQVTVTPLPKQQQLKEQKNRERTPLGRKIFFRIKGSPRIAVKERQIHRCSICNETFNTLVDLKTHLLHHDKPQSVIINIERCNFNRLPPAKTTDASTTDKVEREPAIDPNKQKMLVAKYAGDSAALAFDEETELEDDVKKSLASAINLLDETPMETDESKAEKDEGEAMEIADSAEQMSENENVESGIRNTEKIIEEENSTQVVEDEVTMDETREDSAAAAHTKETTEETTNEQENSSSEIKEMSNANESSKENSKCSEVEDEQNDNDSLLCNVSYSEDLNKETSNCSSEEENEKRDDSDKEHSETDKNNPDDDKSDKGDKDEEDEPDTDNKETEAATNETSEEDVDTNNSSTHEETEVAADKTDNQEDIDTGNSTRDETEATTDKTGNQKDVDTNNSTHNGDSEEILSQATDFFDNETPLLHSTDCCKDTQESEYDTASERCETEDEQSESLTKKNSNDMAEPQHQQVNDQSKQLEIASEDKKEEVPEDLESISNFVNSFSNEDSNEESSKKRKRSAMVDKTLNESSTVVSPVKKKVRFACDDEEDEDVLKKIFNEDYTAT